jgi:hypothetical protein
MPTFRNGKSLKCGFDGYPFGQPWAAYASTPSCPRRTINRSLTQQLPEGNGGDAKRVFDFSDAGCEVHNQGMVLLCTDVKH